MLTERLDLGSKVSQKVEVSSKFKEANPTTPSPIMRSLRMRSHPYILILTPILVRSSEKATPQLLASLSIIICREN